MSTTWTFPADRRWKSEAPAHPADLDSLLRVLDVRVEPFAVCDVRQAGVLPLQPQACATFHYVLTGRGALSVEEHGRYILRAHSVVILPPGLAQRIEAPDAPGCAKRQRENVCVDSSEGLAWLRAGSGQRRLLMACGRLDAAEGGATGLFERVRGPIVEAFEDDSPLRCAFRSLLTEFEDPRAGTSTLRTILMKECLVHVLRRLYERKDTNLQWLAAIFDPRLAPALLAILSRPADPLNVASLAELSGMSRSSFSHHFTVTLGIPPHEFLSERRLERAARLLVHTNLPVKTVAGRVGFKSRSHFSHAFRTRFGIDPLGYRHAAGLREGEGVSA